MADSTAIGNAGEHLVMAYLLKMGFQAFMADRGNTAFDIACVNGERKSLIRVKTTTSNMVKWSAKKDGSLFLDMRRTDDFVAVVDLRESVSGALIYLIPTPVVANDIDRVHRFYYSHPKPDGTPRKETLLRGVYLNGAPKPTNIAYGFEDTWRPYLWNWDQLRHVEPQRRRTAA